MHAPIDVEESVTNETVAQFLKKHKGRPTKKRAALNTLQMMEFIAVTQLDQLGPHVLKPCELAEMVLGTELNPVLLADRQNAMVSLEIVRVDHENFGHWVLVVQQHEPRRTVIWEPTTSQMSKDLCLLYTSPSPRDS